MCVMGLSFWDPLQPTKAHAGASQEQSESLGEMSVGRNPTLLG